MRQQYFELLLNKAREAADDKDLLDRIERLVMLADKAAQPQIPALAVAG